MKAWLGLGSNLGDRRANLTAALRSLRDTGVIDEVSSVYESEPVGLRDQPDFWNLVITLHTELRPRPLLISLKQIEAEMGRVAGARWGPRLIDIDILMYDQEIVSEPGLSIPHPRMLDRGFVMRPMHEIDPDVIHPETGKRIRELTAGREFERLRRLFPGWELLDAGRPTTGGE